MVVILIELKAQEKRTAISAGVSEGEDEGVPKDVSGGLIGKLGARRKTLENKALDKSKRFS